MEIVRNMVNITGIADEAELPDRIRGQMIQFSDTDTLYIHENQPEISSIFQIMIKAQINETRRIKTPSGYSVVLDGKKSFKIIYTQKDQVGKASFLEVELPLNTFAEIKDDDIVEHINIYILDAYFELIDSKKIYSNILYLIDIVSKPVMVMNHAKSTPYNRDAVQNNFAKNIINTPAADNTEEYEASSIDVELEAEYL